MQLIEKMWVNNLDNERPVESNIVEEDGVLELTLRPNNFSDFIGQERIKENLSVFIEAT